MSNNDNPFLPGARLAAYLRDSGGDQQDLSITHQETALTAWASKNGLILAKLFKDEARPGASVIKRTAFQEMIAHFHHPDCQEVGLVVWSFSRFARSLDDAQFYKADLRRRGYIIHSLTDQIPNDSNGRFFESAIDWMNEHFREDLSINVRNGLQDNFKRLGAIPGVPPRGFIRKPIDLGEFRDGHPHILHRWIPDPEIIPTIQLAFHMRAAGSPLAEIHAATRLYTSVSSYLDMFTNKIYIGTLEFGETTMENYCDPIIDPLTWSAVQARVKRHAAHHNLSPNNPDNPRRVGSPFLLSGLATCARCGSLLTGNNSRTYQAYICSAAHRLHTCDLPNIPRLALEAAVIDDLSQNILEPHNLQNLQTALQDRLHQSQAIYNHQIREHKKSLATIHRKINHIAAAIAEHGHSRTLLQSLELLEADETVLRTQIAQLESQHKTPIPNLTLDDLTAASSQITALLHSDDAALKRSLLHGMIRSIVIDRRDRTLSGLITYVYPQSLKSSPSPPDDIIITMATSIVPAGAPTRSHTFTTPLLRKKRVPTH